MGKCHYDVSNDAYFAFNFAAFLNWRFSLGLMTGLNDILILGYIHCRKTAGNIKIGVKKRRWPAVSCTPVKNHPWRCKKWGTSLINPGGADRGGTQEVRTPKSILTIYVICSKQSKNQTCQNFDHIAIAHTILIISHKRAGRTPYPRPWVAGKARNIVNIRLG